MTGSYPTTTPGGFIRNIMGEICWPSGRLAIWRLATRPGWVACPEPEGATLLVSDDGVRIFDTADDAAAALREEKDR